MTDDAPRFRLRDALRDLARVPGVATIPIALALVVGLAPLLYVTLGASRTIAAAPDGRAAFRAYETWVATAIIVGAIAARLAAALAASTMVARRDRDDVGLAEGFARALAHGIPATTTALYAVLLVGCGLAGALIGAIPLAAITFVAGPVAAAEGLGPTTAVRRSAALTRGARAPLAAWSFAVFLVQLAPIAIARYTTLRAAFTTAKPPVPPVLHAFQLHAALAIAAVLATAVVQVVVYRRLRDAHAA